MTERDGKTRPVDIHLLPLLTVEQAAKRLNVGATTVKKSIRDGDLAVRDLKAGKGVRRLLRISERDLQAFMDRGHKPPREARPVVRRVPRAEKRYV